MKRLFFFSAIILLLGCRDNTEEKVTPSQPELLQQPYGTPYTLTDSQKFIYDHTALPEITIEMNAAEWNKFLNYYDQNPNNE